MTKDKIWLSSPHMGGRELEFINDAFEENWIAPLGPNVNGFESDLQKYTGAEHAAALSSGTAALHLALIMAGVDRDDIVLCQSFTFSASANPIAYQGAIPVFIDSEEETWNMDPKLLRKACLEYAGKGKKPKAIVVVHLYGMPAKMNEILSIAKEFNIPVIEDAAEALGSTYKGKACGTFSSYGVLSFNGNKIITTSGGGALISDNKEVIDRARFLATQARDNAPHYEHSNIGYNYRMSNICAGIGRGQMLVLDERVKQRRKNFDFYVEHLADLNGISFLMESQGSFSNRWLSTMLVNPEKSMGVDREQIRLALERHNIESRPLWKPMHLQPIFKDAPFYGNGISDKLFENGLCLPSGSNLNNEQLEEIVEIIKNCFQ